MEWLLLFDLWSQDIRKSNPKLLMYSLKIELYVFAQGQWSSRSKDYFDIQKGTFHLLYGDCPLIVSRKLLVRGLLQDQETVHFDVPDERRGTFRKWTYGRPCVATFGDQACSLKRARWHPCVSNCPRSPSASCHTRPPLPDKPRFLLPRITSFFCSGKHT